VTAATVRYGLATQAACQAEPGAARRPADKLAAALKGHTGNGQQSADARAPEHREAVLTFADVVGSGHGVATENIAASQLPVPKWPL